MKFYNWLTQFQALRAEQSSLTDDPLRFYGQLLLDIMARITQAKQKDPAYTATMECVAYNQAHVEGNWYRARCPYFKLYSAITRMLSHTDIKVPCKYVHAPLSTILFRLGEEEIPALCDDAGYMLRAILVDEIYPGEKGRVSEILEPALPNTRRLIFWFDWGEGFQIHAGKRLPIVAFQVIEITDEDELFETVLERWLGRERYDWDKGRTISDASLMSAIRLALGTCLLATNADKVIEADVLNRHVERYRHSADPHVREELFERAKHRGKFGWLVGREISLPSTLRPARDESGEQRGELTRSHLRRGHFHTVLYGKGRSQAKVLWFKPVLVRPDLPAAEASRGYKAKG
jgi:hypothetical protein